MNQPAVQWKLERKSEFAGVGCLLQAIGLVVVWIFPIGTLLGIVLLIYGQQASFFWRCGACGNRVTDKGVRMCPTCHAALSR